MPRGNLRLSLVPRWRLLVAGSLVVLVVAAGIAVVKQTDDTVDLAEEAGPEVATGFGAERTYVEAVTGVSVQDVPISVVSRSNLIRRLEASTSSPELDRWLDRLARLGLAGADPPTSTEFLRYVAAGVAGLYEHGDSEGSERVYIADDLPPTAQRSAVVHELSHAAMDQISYDGPRQGSAWGRVTPDYLAREVPALWVEVRWQSNLGDDEVSELIASGQEAQQASAHQLSRSLRRLSRGPSEVALELALEMQDRTFMDVVRSRSTASVPGLPPSGNRSDLGYQAVEEFAELLALEVGQTALLMDEVLPSYTGDTWSDIEGNDCFLWTIRLSRPLVGPPGQQAMAMSTGAVVELAGGNLVVTTCTSS